MANYTEESVSVGGTTVHLLRGGQGRPLLVLHGAGGPAGWRLYLDRLAEDYTVYAPSHPGFGSSGDAEWMENIRDLAEFYLWFLDELDLDQVDVIGFSMGGWLAAEMAVMSPRTFGKIVLVGAAGLQPEQGEIFDIFFIPMDELGQHAYHDARQAPEYEELFGAPPTPEQRDIMRRNREMAARLTWKPYMFSRQLPRFLPRVTNPALVVWGQQDGIVPAICGEQYERLLPNARRVTIDQCGHSPQIERPNEFLAAVRPFLAGETPAGSGAAGRTAGG